MSNANGCVAPSSVRSPCTREPAAAGHALDLARLERDALLLEHFLVDRLMDVRLVVLAERLHAAGALDDAQRGTVDLELEGRVGEGRAHLEHGLPGRHLEREVVARLGRGATAFRAHHQRSVVRSEPIAACRNRHERSV